MRDEQPSTDGAREEFLTARQLAALLQVSESTVRRLAREGRIPAIRLTPRITRFRLKDVLHALDGAGRSRSSRRPAPAEDNSQLSLPDLL